MTLFSLSNKGSKGEIVIARQANREYNLVPRMVHRLSNEATLLRAIHMGY